jgi:hypothetical protein
MIHIDLDPVVYYDMTEFAKKYNIDKNDLETNLIEWFAKQNKIEKTDGYSKDYVEGYRNGWSNAIEDAWIESPMCDL